MYYGFVNNEKADLVVWIKVNFFPHGKSLTDIESIKSMYAVIVKM